MTTGFAIFFTLAVMLQWKGSRLKSQWWRLGFQWASFVFGLVAGTAMVDTFLGGWTSAISGLHPAVLWIGAAIQLVWIIADVAADRDPDVPALVCGITLPAWTVGAGGSVGDALHNFFTFVGSLGGYLGSNWFGG